MLSEWEGIRFDQSGYHVQILLGIDNYGILRAIAKSFSTESTAVHLNIVMLLIIKVNNVHKLSILSIISTINTHL